MVLKALKFIVFFSLCCGSFYPTAFAQSNGRKIDSLYLELMQYDSIYIQSYRQQLNTNISVSNDLYFTEIPYAGEEGFFIPNLNNFYSLDFNYDWLSVRLGFRPPVSESNERRRGESDIFRLRVKFIFRDWSHRWQYNWVQGFYITNTDQISEFDQLENLIQFPNMINSSFSGNTSRKSNPNYSIKAVESQTERQLRSAGSLMFGATYGISKIKGMDNYINAIGFPVDLDDYREYLIMYLTPYIGYHYTYVFAKKAYLNFGAEYGMGMNYNKTFIYGEQAEKEVVRSYLFDIALRGNFNAGYSGRKWYGGLTTYYINNVLTNNNPNSITGTSAAGASLFIGYRFDPPKKVVQSVDVLEGTLDRINPLTNEPIKNK